MSDSREQKGRQLASTVHHQAARHPKHADRQPARQAATQQDSHGINDKYRMKVVLPVPFWPSMTRISEAQKSPEGVVRINVCRKQN
jgi:hypothetical protein